MKVLAEGLRKCANCDSKLSLIDIISESSCGYGSHLIIKCICGTDNKVSTGTMHHTFESDTRQFWLSIACVTLVFACVTNICILECGICYLFNIA